MLQERLQVSRPSFTYLCHLLESILSKKDTKFIPCILIEGKISLTLHQLGSSDTLHTLADLYVYQSQVLRSLLERFVRRLISYCGPLFFKDQHREG
jgi:hypothetical protein